MIGLKVLRGTIRLSRDYTHGEIIPASEQIPEKNRRALLSLGKVREVEIRDEWPKHHGGPWFITEDGEKHRGKQAALAHMGES